MNICAPDLFAALAHETRLRCLMLLLECDEMCVCELTEAIGAPQPTVSRHLAQLRALGLVLDRRDGHWIHYRVNPAIPDWARGLLRDTRQAVGDDAPYVDDRAALAAMRAPGGRTGCG